MNYALKGKTYQEVTFTVDRDRVLQFCDAIGEDNPIFRDPAAAKEAGYDEQLAPPTFPTVMQIMTSGQVVMDQELGLNYMMVVHAEQEYEYHRPLKVGDELTAVPRRRLRRPVGSLSTGEMRALNRAIFVFLGLSETEDVKS